MLTLHAVRYRLASDSLNSMELVQRLLPQIEASQPTLHAFTVVLAESALAATWPWNVLGWPAITVPAGFSSEGLPVGVQLLGPPNREPLLVSLACQLTALTGYTGANRPASANNRHPSHGLA